jgi:hypothetical protein
MKNKIQSVFNKILRQLEIIGTYKAAAELERMGYKKEAHALLSRL